MLNPQLEARLFKLRLSVEARMPEMYPQNVRIHSSGGLRTDKGTLYKVHIATATARNLNADCEDTWTYEVERVGDGAYARILVKDDTGQFLGYV